MNHGKVPPPAAHPVAPLHHAQGPLPGQHPPQQGTGRPADAPGRFGDALFMLGRAGLRLAQGAARGLRPQARGSARPRSQDSGNTLDGDLGDEGRRGLAASFSMQTDTGDGESDGHEAGADQARSQQRRRAGTAAAVPWEATAQARWAQALLAQGGHAALKDALALRCMDFGTAGAQPVRTQVLPITAAALAAAGGRLDFGGWTGVREHLLKADASLRPPRTGLSTEQQQMNLLRPLLLHQLGLPRTTSQLDAVQARSAVLCLVGPPPGGSGAAAGDAPPGSADPQDPTTAGSGPLSQRADDVV
jgi:hypothetical protein